MCDLDGVIYMLYYKYAALWFVGYEPYDTPFYPRNVAIAVIVCFFVLITFILIVNLIGFVIGTASRPRPVVVQQRMAQI